MAEAEGIPPTASVASVGPGIRYVGNYAYALSGIIDTDNSETTFLDFTSGVGVIVADINVCYPVDSGLDFMMKLYFNDVIVQQYLIVREFATMRGWGAGLAMIIPPFTLVKLTGANVTSGATEELIASIAGRVYDV